jgi:hypothetical protein
MNLLLISSHPAVHDSGPVYFETAVRSGIVEPWNSFSSLVYLIPVVWFLIKLYPEYSKHRFLMFFACPLLFVGGTGSTLYHAFRSSQLLMWLDVMPIFILTLSLGAWFLWMTYRRILWAILLLVGFVGVRFLGFVLFELQAAINISYFLTGIYMFIPAWFLLKKTNFQGIGLLLVSVFLFAVALFMRWYDDFPLQLFEAGTHWLWHIFSAAGALLLGFFIVKQNRIAQSGQ